MKSRVCSLSRSSWSHRTAKLPEITILLVRGDPVSTTGSTFSAKFFKCNSILGHLNSLPACQSVCISYYVVTSCQRSRELLMAHDDFESSCIRITLLNKPKIQYASPNLWGCHPHSNPGCTSYIPQRTSYAAANSKINLQGLSAPSTRKRLRLRSDNVGFAREYKIVANAYETVDSLGQARSAHLSLTKI